MNKIQWNRHKYACTSTLAQVRFFRKQHLPETLQNCLERTQNLFSTEKLEKMTKYQLSSLEQLTGLESSSESSL